MPVDWAGQTQINDIIISGGLKSVSYMVINGDYLIFILNAISNKLVILNDFLDREQFYYDRWIKG